MATRFRIEILGLEIFSAAFDGTTLAFEGNQASIAAGDDPHLLHVEGEGAPGTSVEVFISSSAGDAWVFEGEIGPDRRFSLVQQIVPEPMRGDDDDSDDGVSWLRRGDDWPGPRRR